MRIATWNVEWANPSTSVGKRISGILENLEADVIVLTEGCAELLPLGNVVDAGRDWGYPVSDLRRRKVILWTKWEISDVRTETQLAIPPGRFVGANVKHPHGEFQVFGICIPWKDAHVRSGQRNRNQWQDHQQFLSGLKQEIDRWKTPLVVAGDFNQRIPRGNQPREVFDRMADCMSKLEVVSTLDVPKPLIDHIAISEDFVAGNAEVIPDFDEFGKLSDHRGVVVDLH